MADSTISMAQLEGKWRVRRSAVEGLERVTDSGISKGGRTGKSAAERVGKGHFGEVVKAMWHGEAVVVKVSRTKSLDERRMREARADLENECRLLA
jgi:predicted Ser/Thr protein kinase